MVAVLGALDVIVSVCSGLVALIVTLGVVGIVSGVPVVTRSVVGRCRSGAVRGVVIVLPFSTFEGCRVGKLSKVCLNLSHLFGSIVVAGLVLCRVDLLLVLM